MRKSNIFLLVISGFIIVCWASLWAFLVSYDKSMPNSALISFSKNKIYDLDNPKIIKGETSNSFYIYEKDKKILELSAIKNGTDWEITEKENFVSPIFISAPKDSEVLIKNLKLFPTSDKKEGLSESYLQITDEKNLPNVNIYKISSYLSMPELSLISEIGNNCEILKGDNNNIIMTLPISKKAEKEFRGKIEEVAKIYARYITNDAKFAELSKLLYKNTSYYNEVRLFFNDWYAHDSYDFKDVKVSNIIRTADNAFEGDIEFTYVQKKGRKEITFPSKYHIPFVFSDNKWQAVMIEIL